MSDTDGSSPRELIPRPPEPIQAQQPPDRRHPGMAQPAAFRPRQQRDSPLAQHTVSLVHTQTAFLNQSGPTNSAGLPLLPAADDFDRPTLPCVTFQELTQIWVIDHSLLLEHVCGTICLSICMILNLLSWSSAGY